MSKSAFKKTTCRWCDVDVEYPNDACGQMASCPKCGKDILLIEKAKGGVERTAMREIGGSAPSSSFHAAKSNASSEPVWGTIIIGAVVGWLLVLAIAWLAYGHWNEIGNGIFGMVIFIVLITISLVVYFFPTYIAGKRSHKNFAAIFALNLLTGWSFIGWVIALVWAFKND